MATATYKPVKLVINTTEIPFSNVSIDPGLSMELLKNGVSVEPTFCAVKVQDGMINADTPALKIVNTLLGTDFAVLLTAGELWFDPIGDGATYTAGDDAVKVAFSDGLCVLNSMRGSSGATPGMATASLTCHCAGDADNAPFVITTGQASPTTTPLAELFTLGEMVLDTQTVDPIDVTISTNFELDKRVTGGGAYISAIGVIGKQVKIDVTLNDATPWSTSTTANDTDAELIGEALADFVVYFRQYKEGAAREATTASKHIKVAAALAQVVPGTAGGAWGGLASCNLSIYPQSVSEAEALTITSDQAYA